MSLLVEGDADEVVLRRVLAHVGLKCGAVYGKRGKSHVLERLPSYNQAAKLWPWVVVVDLNQDAPCAPDFVRAYLARPATCMRFRVAVRAVEAWLLADAERIASFLRVPRSRIPVNPDAQGDPKGDLVEVARRSRSKVLSKDMVPRPGSGGRVGPAYTSRIKEFVTIADHRWRPDVAAENSDSLRRCVEALHTLRACLEAECGGSP